MNAASAHSGRVHKRAWHDLVSFTLKITQNTIYKTNEICYTVVTEIKKHKRKAKRKGVSPMNDEQFQAASPVADGMGRARFSRT